MKPLLTQPLGRSRKSKIQNPKHIQTTGNVLKGKAQRARAGYPSVIGLLLMAALGWRLGLSAPAVLAQTAPTPKARVLLVTGVDYPGHVWRQTAPVLAQALRQDGRLEVRVVEDPNFLDSAAIETYNVIVLHFQNWEQPGPGEAARENLRKFVASGKGLVLVHFACGAWHGEWPEFAQIAGRVWFGSNPGPGKRQHDPYGPFRVEAAEPNHPIMRGLADFETQDELYTCLTGEHPIEILAQAKSKGDGKYYPMAFVSRYQQGRTFHCVLGHDAEALSVPGVQELYRRGCAWAAGLSPVPTLTDAKPK
jgi:type 1 glutamine amidotransferase